MNCRQTGLAMGLSCTLPVVVWTLATLDTAPLTGAAAVISAAITALVISQALAASIFAPWCAGHADGQDGIMGTILLILVPLPLTAIGWLAGAAAALSLCLAQSIALLLALLAFAVARLLHHATPEPAWNLMRAILQVMTAVPVWAFRNAWLSWLEL